MVIPLIGLLLAAPSLAAEQRYRIELIVFQNLNVLAEPDRSQDIRRFTDVFELSSSAPGEVPVFLDKPDGSFSNIWSRLDRLADYDPLIRLTFEQTFFDYHPPVRVHNDTVMARELRFPSDIIYLDLTQAAESNPSAEDAPLVNLFEDFEQPLYQLDGSIQLRRSRFLHIEMDLEYRLEGPAWERVFPTQADDLLEPGFEWLGAAPDTVQEGPATAPEPVAGTPIETGPDSLTGPATGDMDAASESVLPEPFEFHRLAQSRQIRSNTLQYFDSAFLGAVVRVTPIADDAAAPAGGAN